MTSIEETRYVYFVQNGQGVDIFMTDEQMEYVEKQSEFISVIRIDSIFDMNNEGKRCMRYHPTIAIKE